MKRHMICRVVLVLALALVVGAFFPGAQSYASQQQHPHPQQQTYVVMWPDGSTQTFTDKEKALEAADEWKLLEEGTTDENGKIKLSKKLWAEGKLKIEEVEVPEGYLAPEETIQYATVKDGSVTFVNEKQGEEQVSKGAEDEIEEPEEAVQGVYVDEEEETTPPPKKNKSPKTGDESGLLGLLFLLTAGAAMVGALRQKKQQN